jgi:tetratricopeptide (TPR) repeat protein
MASALATLNSAVTEYAVGNLPVDGHVSKCTALGDRYFAEGNLRAAAAHYEQALRAEPQHAAALAGLGSALGQLGEWERAVACLDRASRLAPTPETLNNLGMALRGQGRWFDAAAAFEQALTLQSDRPEIAFNLGATLHEGGALDRAGDAYRQALRLRPNYADAANNLATLLKEQGALVEAIVFFTETLKLKPDHALAHFSLSDLAAAGSFEFPAAQVEYLKGLLACGHGSLSELSLYSFAVATVLNSQAHYDEAFGFYEKANNLRKSQHVTSNSAFDAQAHADLIDRIIASFSRAYFERVKKWGTLTETPVFIVGMPRSGSTLVEQILASHPRVFGAGETGDVYQFVTQSVAPAGAGLYRAPILPNVRAARKAGTEYLRRLELLGAGAARVTIKTLQNFLHLGLIVTLFPRAHVIHCRREPLDVCLSCYFQNFQSVPFACDLADIGAYHRAYEKLMGHWSRVLPIAIHEIGYEDLIERQEGITRELLDFCGLAWDERCLTFFKTRRAVRTASTVQVRKPMSTRAIGRWKNYRHHLGPLFEALGESCAGQTEPRTGVPPPQVPAAET